MKKTSVQAIKWSSSELQLLDQRRLPHNVEYLTCRSVEDVVSAIKNMVVRGAPAIGITAAYGVVISLTECQQILTETEQFDWQEKVREDLVLLGNSRPTAVNLAWALARMEGLIELAITQGQALESILSLAETEAVDVHETDIKANYLMGQLGANHIAESSRPSPAILTHCNTGSLATGGYGTALGVVRACHENGLIERVYADESRPWLQGSRLTAWELLVEEIPCSVISDSAAAYMMSQGDIGWVVVGADRIAANGDVANKIGTYSLAIAAQFHRVKFMVVAPSSTFDLTLLSGDDIPIEEREPNEILCWPDGSPIAPEGAQAVNPVFDITPADLIDVIVTEKGVIEDPNAADIRALLNVEQLH